MPTVIFVHPDGRRSELQVPAGTSAMRAAIGHGIDGIAADCGGCLSCATCHVYVDAGWVARLPAVQNDEASMLEMTAAEAMPTSRLSCQLILTLALDGLLLHLPETQY